MATSILIVALLAALIQSTVPQAKRDDQIEVYVIGCASGDTLTETNLNQTTSAEGLNPSRRWRLRLTSEQRAQLKAISKKQVAIFGAANRDEIKGATVVKSKQVGTGRIYVGTEASRSAQSAAVRSPTLIVGTITPREEACR